MNKLGPVHELGSVKELALANEDSLPAQGTLSDKRPHLLAFPALATKRIGESQWRLEISGVVFRKRPKRIKRRVLLNLLGKLMRVPPAELAGDLFLERVAPFFFEPRKGYKIRLVFGNRILVGRRRSNRGGHVRSRFKVTTEELAAITQQSDPNEFSLQALVKSRAIDLPTATVRVQIIAPTGLSVISDIDDTIKISKVNDRRELLLNTFLREFQSVEGMNRVYQQLASETGASFHYVSASPWQLFDPLEHFLRTHDFPNGSMHLRTFRLSDQLLKRLGILYRGGKVKVIRKIIKAFPDRKFVMIGDSNEKDPEIYLRIFQMFPNQIEAIVIRLVSPDHSQRESIRVLQSFKHPRIKTFQTPAELVEILTESNLIRDKS